ncbi:T9SS sorting signal type C domain-containing protein [Flavobacterium adhaerens]|uniref:T9SS sorting signal type C domain-containing protein n=1 Tax=Flavobacterium adhaerens TaxID=3149043 RepID=UPI0032B52966
MKKKLLFSALIALFIHDFAIAATITTAQSGNWNDTSTWVGGIVPIATDDVIITRNITITENTTCKTITLQGNNTALIVNDTFILTVTGKITADSSNTSKRNTYLSGDGTITCASFDLGDETTPNNSAIYTQILSTVAQLNILGDLTIVSSGATYYNNSTFSLEKGIMTLDGQIKIINDGIIHTDQVSTFTMPTYMNLTVGASPTPTTTTHDKTLILNYTGNPFDYTADSHTEVILNGNKATVRYAASGNQEILNTEYNNLNLATGGVKLFPVPSINIKNRLSINSGVTANLGSGGTHTTTTLSLASTLQQIGTWGSTSSTASNKNDTFFTNTGIITVGTPCTATAKTWNGTAWDGDGLLPTIAEPIIFAGDYTAPSNLSGCSCTVNSGNVTIPANLTLEISNEVTVNGGSLTFENNASLIQYADTPNSGDITFKRNTTALVKYDYTFWSSPVASMTLTGFSPYTVKGYQSFNNDAWAFVSDATMNPGVGFAVMAPTKQIVGQYDPTSSPVETDDTNFVDGSTFEGKFIGVPNNGDIPVPTTGTWQLVGNPYPSSIDTDAFIEANPDLYSTFYFWTHANPVSSSNPGDYDYNYNSADYALRNNTGSTSTDPDETTRPAIDKIASGQGFFIATQTTNPIVFTNAMRVDGSGTQFFKMSKKNKTEKNRIWLNLTNNEGLFKQILIGYVDGATNDYDKQYDGTSFRLNKYADFFSVNNGSRLIIQGRELPFNDTDEVPLGYTVNLGKGATVANQFTISIAYTDGSLDTQPVYLYDKVTSTTYDLRQSNYTFSSVDGTFSDRFVLKYTNKNLAVDDIEKTDNAIIITSKNKIITVSANSEKIENVVVYDLSGKTIYKKDKIENSVLEIASLKAQNQVLLVKVNLESGISTTKKVLFN